MKAGNLHTSLSKSVSVRRGFLDIPQYKVNDISELQYVVLQLGQMGRPNVRRDILPA